MDPDAIALFSALADRSPSEREAYYAEHQIAAAVRDEVESLLRFDATDGIGRYFASAVDELVAESAAVKRSARFGPFRPIRLLGRGGMGQVFLAEQEAEEFRRQVALKLIDRPVLAEQDIRRFRDEVRILASLEHPGIARFLDAGRAPDGTWFLALEYVQGEDLFEHVRRVEPPVEERIQIFLSILEAVAYAHAHRVVHRDLKPSNILVGPDGRPRLLDFGIAKLLDPESGASATLTRTELRAFTPAYASPEQFRGERETPATDVHSLGVLLYELLAGIHPFGAPSRSRASLESAVLTEDPAPPSAAARRGTECQDAAAADESKRTLPPGRGRIGADLDAICLKALRKEPLARYPDAAAFAEDLRRFLAGLPVEARHGGRRYRVGRFLHRNRGWLATGSAAAYSCPPARRWRHVFKSPSAFRSQPRASSRLTSSGAFIDDFSVLVCRIGDSADDAFRLLEAFRAHHDEIDRDPESSQRFAKPATLLPCILDIGFQHEEVDIAVPGHLPCRRRTEEDDTVWPRNPCNAVHDALYEAVVNLDHGLRGSGSD